MHSNYQPQKSPCVSSFPTTYKTLHYPQLQANIISSVLDHISVMPPCAVLHKLDFDQDPFCQILDLIFTLKGKENHLLWYMAR